MPRRKQDCPKRMKWELENLAALAALRAKGGGVISNNDTVLNHDSSDSGSEAENDDGTKSNNSSITGDSPSRGGSESPRDSHSPSPFKTPSPRPNSTNGSILDFSQPSRNTSNNRKDPISGEIPLDLSVSHRGSGSEHHPPPRKVPKWADGGRVAGSWNGALSNQDMTSKALEKMSELSRVPQQLGGDGGKSSNSRGGNRGNSSSSWQAQWLAQSSCGTKDVLRCVCCRLTFPSLLALSAHMKEANHGPPIPNLPSPKGQIPAPSPVSTISQPKPPSPNDSASLLKETVHLPRKLVRGQDVWLGKGAEQTRQILKCMWCGQSFRSLAEMTSHMQQTQHYTNIISQEQLISWRSSEDKSSSPNSHVSAVLTCKVCDQAFSSLKELSNHMVKNSHYKEHIMRSITESGSRRRQSREKRKKSLPVRKLLELERANTELKKEIKITCEKCSEKIPAPAFVEHLRLCEKGLGAMSLPSKLKSSSSPKKLNLQHQHQLQEPEPVHDLSTNSNKDKDDSGKKEPSSVLNAIEKMIEKSFDFSRSKGGGSGSNNGNNPQRISPPVGSSILKRLGIDESVDYTKPLLDPTMLPMPPKFLQSRSRSVSSEHSESENIKPTPSSPPINPPTPTGSSQKSITPDIGEDVCRSSDKHDSESEELPTINHTNHQMIPNKSIKSKSKTNSLSALSSMFESIGGSGDRSSKEGSKSPSSHNFQPNSSSHHPLAALQQLCDKTENTPPSVSSRPTSTSSSTTAQSPGVDPSSLLGLNWAVNDGENVFKCTFCETPFMSKGAYRHHLAKMHFVQDKSPSTPGTKEESSSTPSTTTPLQDSTASKFIKYTELAKQLSSK